MSFVHDGVMTDAAGVRADFGYRFGSHQSGSAGAGEEWEKMRRAKMDYLIGNILFGLAVMASLVAAIVTAPM